MLVEVLFTFPVELVGVVTFTLPVDLVELADVVVLTFPLEFVELEAVVLLTLVVFEELELVAFVVALTANEVGNAFLGTLHWHLLDGSTFVVVILLQSVHVQVVKLVVELVPTVTLQTQF